MTTRGGTDRVVFAQLYLVVYTSTHGPEKMGQGKGTQHMTASLELPRISIKQDTKRAEARPFVGRVVNDSLQPGKYDVEKNPYQWTLAVEPLKSADGTKGFQVGGKTGAFWEYISVPAAVFSDGEIKEQTKFGRHFLAFKKVFGTSDDLAIGRGEYRDTVAWFIKDKVEYGTDKQTGAVISSGVLLPVRTLTPDEMVEYGLAAPGTSTPPPTDYSEDDLNNLLAALEGKDRNALQKAAFQAKLPNGLRQGVGRGDGPAIQALLTSGKARFDGDVLRAA